jgi:hypothetical protein
MCARYRADRCTIAIRWRPRITSYLLATRFFRIQHGLRGVREPDMTDCLCLQQGPRHPDVVNERSIGCDETEGRFAAVGLKRCARCGTLWLRYHVEYEGFTASGRWAETPIAEEVAAETTPESAAEFLDAAEWYIYGGSYYGHGGRRSSGPLHWGQ